MRVAEGQEVNDPVDTLDARTREDPQVVEADANSFQANSLQEATMAETEEIEKIEKKEALDLDVVAELPLVARTTFDSDNRVGVEWRGRCWAWLTAGEAPALMEVVVSDGEVVKLLAPGEVRRVRAILRPVETPEGPVNGLEVWMDFDGEAQPDERATARGLHEGGKVRITESTLRGDIKGKIGRLERFATATIIVDGRRYIVGLKDLEPIEDDREPSTGTEDTEAAPKGS